MLARARARRRARAAPSIVLLVSYHRTRGGTFPRKCTFCTAVPAFENLLHLLVRGKRPGGTPP